MNHRVGLLRAYRRNRSSLLRCFCSLVNRGLIVDPMDLKEATVFAIVETPAWKIVRRISAQQPWVPVTLTLPDTAGRSETRSRNRERGSRMDLFLRRAELFTFPVESLFPAARHLKLGPIRIHFYSCSIIVVDP